jgi:hypothetical protein
MLDEQLYRRMGRRFASVLSLWGACEDLHMVIIATFSVTAAGIPNVGELFLMPVTQHWLPIASAFEKQLVDRLASDNRSFVKGLRYDLASSSASASATLTDCEGLAPVLFIADEGVEHGGWAPLVSDPSTPVWVWNPSSETMPMLPPRRSHHISETVSTEDDR